MVIAKIHKELWEHGESCGKNRVARLMKVEDLKAQVGYNRKPATKVAKPLFWLTTT